MLGRGGSEQRCRIFFGMARDDRLCADEWMMYMRNMGFIFTGWDAAAAAPQPARRLRRSSAHHTRPHKHMRTQRTSARARARVRAGNPERTL